MTNRIQDLAEQAFFETEYDDVQDLRETMERFAELIVRECVNMCNTNEDYISAFNIKEYFGLNQ